jgi:predicted HicB family RNase H-like nuclease
MSTAKTKSKSVQSLAQRATELLHRAELMARNGANWAEVHNALWGVGGLGLSLFPQRHERATVMNTKEYGKIREILEQLPDPPGESAAHAQEQSGRILVRVPKTVHAALAAEAAAEGTSLNQLIVAKLSVQLRALV